MINKNLFLQKGGFDPEFTVCEDYDLWLKISKDNLIGFIEDDLIIKYGGHEDQLSHKYKAMIILELNLYIESYQHWAKINMTRQRGVVKKM